MFIIIGNYLVRSKMEMMEGESCYVCKVLEKMVIFFYFLCVFGIKM